MEGSLEFFQHHFCRGISIDKFNKEYSYNIRYMYGKEGRRIALNPHPCRVLIKAIPSGEQCHGSPLFGRDLIDRLPVCLYAGR